MAYTNVKEEARRLMDDLPEDATWEDAMYKIYVRQAIEQGLEDSRAGRTLPVEEVRKKVGGRFVDLREKGIDEEDAATLRAQLLPFAEDWESPEMAIYDDYDAARSQTR